MQRAAVIHPHLALNGGGSSVAAWAIEALRDRYDVSLITWAAPDLPVINRIFGSSLRDDDLRVCMPPRALRAVVDGMPGDNIFLRRNTLLRYCAILDSRQPFDVMLSTDDECALPRPGIQYVHCPHPYRPPPWEQRTALQKIPGVLSAYRIVCELIWKPSATAIGRNRTLVNSHYIAGVFREMYGGESEIVYPPVPAGFPDVPWQERENAFVSIARLVPYKRITQIIGIVAGVRRRGHDVGLHLVGTSEDAGYLAHLRAEAARNPWLWVHADVSRDEMVRIVAAQRYGIHAMPGEHFGIGPAELVRAGCLPFFPALGGPAEIVGQRPELLFADDDAAVERIDAVLRNAPLQLDLRRHLAQRAQQFSEDHFMAEILRIAAECAR